jgi:hypothetical protein
MNRNRAFVLLTAAGGACLLYLLLFGDRINSAGVVELIIVGALGLALVVIFVWMFFDCLSFKGLRRKWLWVLAFLFGTYVTAVFYFFLVYRKKFEVSTVTG